MSEYQYSNLNVGTMAPNESGKENLGGSRPSRSALGLPQRIADCDPVIKEKIRNKVKSDIFINPAPMMPYVFFNMSVFSFLLPMHWGLHPPDFVKALETALVDVNIMEYFCDKGIINWSNAISKLYPLRTTGDGNCLLHAISLFLWGIEDLDLQMRRILYQEIFNDNVVKKYKQRWQLGRTAFDQGICSGGLRYDTMNWDDEWKLVIRNSSPEPNPDGQQMLPYHSLEEIHIFIMSNVLRRPIIVLADTMFRDIDGISLQPQNVTGIYLPVLSKPKDCCTHPIVLGYHQNHFVPLVGKNLLPNENLDMVIQLCTKDFGRFPVHFLLPDEKRSEQRLLDTYLQPKQMAHPSSSQTMLSIMAASLGTKEFPESASIMKTYFRLAEKNYQSGFRGAARASMAAPLSGLQNSRSDLKICCMCNKDPADGDNDVCNKCLVTNCTSFHPSASAPPESMPIVSNEFNKFNLEESRRNDPGVPPQNPSYQFPPGSNYRQPAQQDDYSIRVDKPCKTPACQFYCSSQLPGDYCHTCSKKTPSVGRRTKLEKCRTEGCQNQANPERQGLCDICSGTHHLKKQLNPQVVGYESSSTQIPTEFRSSYQGRSNMTYQGRTSILDDPSGLDSLAISQSNIGSKKCLEPSCKLTGQDSLQGFCSKCFGKNIQIHKRVENVPQVPQCSTLKQGSLEEIRSAVPRISTGGIGSSSPQPSAVTFQTGIRDEKCKTEKCDLFGTEEQNGFCTKCLTDILRKDSEMRNVCKNPCCSRKVYQDGYCVECFEHTPNLSGVGHPSGVSLQSASLNSFGQHSGTSLLNTCESNGCNGLVVILGDGRHCYDCHQLPRDQRSLPQQQLMICVYPKCDELTPQDNPICMKCQGVLDAANKSERAEQALKANTMSPAPSAVLKVPCTRCTSNFAGSNGLCNECRLEMKFEDSYNIGLAKKEEFIRNQGHPCKNQACKSPGCDMFGTPEFQGYCSRCFRSTEREKSRSEPIKPSSRMHQSSSKLPEEVPYKARLCVKGCGQWANVQVLDGLCNKCYRLYNTDYPGRRIAQSARVVEPNVPRPDARNKNRTDQHCFAPACTNRGNPSSGGFCNSCYRKLQANDG